MCPWCDHFVSNVTFTIDDSGKGFIAERASFFHFKMHFRFSHVLRIRNLKLVTSRSGPGWGIQESRVWMQGFELIQRGGNVLEFESEDWECIATSDQLQCNGIISEAEWERPSVSQRISYITVGWDEYSINKAILISMIYERLAWLSDCLLDLRLIPAKLGIYPCSSFAPLSTTDDHWSKRAQ